jgi:excisionase family DNA binding protein
MYIEEQIKELRQAVNELENKTSKIIQKRIYSERAGPKAYLDDTLYTVKEVAKIIRTTPGYVYELVKKGYLPALKLGSLKIRRQTLCNFLERSEGKDMSDLDDVKTLFLETKSNNG